MKARFSEVGPMSDSLWSLCLVFRPIYLLRVSLRSGKQYLGVLGLSSVLFLSFAALCSTWDLAPCCSVTTPCPTLCNPMDCSTPGFLVHHQLPEPGQTHVCQSWWCHLTISSSVVTFSLCCQSFPAPGSFRVGCLHQLAKVLEPPDQGWNRCSLLWKRVVLTTGLPGKSQQHFGLIFLKKYI